MSKKPVIALLANFPLAVADASYAKGGWHSATWLAAMYEMLADCSDYEIHWITFFKGIFARRTFEKNGQFFHVLPVFSLKYAQKTHYLHARIQVARELRRIQPDVLHVWGAEGRYAVAGMDYKGKKILTVQGNLTACEKRAPMPPFMVRQAVWERLAYSHYDVFTGESPWSLERIKELRPQSTRIQWDYCLEGIFYEAQRCPAEQPCCLVAGSDIPLKNFKTAIAAFSSPELAHVKLLLAGVQPESYPNLPSNIVALGGVSRQEMVRLLSETWCLVHPSLADTGPTVVKEARVIGVPVVLSDQCGSQQYVEHGKSGFVIQPMDEAALVRSVLAVTASRETTLAMGSHGQMECRQTLSRENMMAGLHRLYRQMLSM